MILIANFIIFFCSLGVSSFWFVANIFLLNERPSKDLAVESLKIGVLVFMAGCIVISPILIGRYFGLTF